MTIKIQKFLSNLGYGSRRNIEKMIISGNIFLNGEKAIIGQRLKNKNFREIKINGKILLPNFLKLNSRVLIYNKPEGEICTRKDPQKRKNVFNKLPFLKMNRWVSVGRLDINTRGLLLFTNDGNLANQLMHPRNKVEREYYMRVFGKINKNTMNILRNGVKINNIYTAFKDLTPLINKQSGKNQWFKGVLCEGKNREIRSMWKQVKCEVNRLIRIRYGQITLPKSLKLGSWIELDSTLVNELYKL